MTDEIDHLPPPVIRRSPHIFAAPVFVQATQRFNPYPQTERHCSVCGAVKVTVHHPDGRGWREWRMSATGLQCTRADPPCTAPPPAGSP